MTKLRTHARSSLGARGNAVIAGVDVGGTKTHAVILDGRGDIVGEARIPTRRGADGVVRSVVDAVRGAATAVPGRHLTGVGIGVPGAVDDVGIVSRAVNLDIADLDLAGAVARALDVATAVDNDVNLAALGAMRLLDLRADASLAFLNIGTGMGAGIVLDGRLRRGGSGAAGEIGHLPFDAAGPVCGCGMRGCLELYASGSGLLRFGRRPVAELFAAAQRGEDESARIVDRFCRALALAIRILVQSVDVEVVAVGGGVAASHPLFAARLEGVLHDAERDSPFVASLGLRRRVVVIDPSRPVAALGAASLFAVSADAG